MPGIDNVLIAIITYKRVDSLSRLIDSILHLDTSVTWRVAVVDNDPLGSALPVIPERDPRFSYHVEPVPGIPAARNACLDLLAWDDDALVFVDDDETVTPKWLYHLTHCAAAYGADIVAGPVISVVPASAPSWLIKGAYFQHPKRATGSTRTIPATNNVLIRADVLKHHGVRFDDRYRKSGGSDSDFFLRLRMLGIEWVWCSEAEVYEHVQVERVSRKWLFWRYVRGGEVYTRLPNQTSRSKLLMKSFSYFAASIVLLPVSLVRADRRRLNMVLLARSLGIARGLLGMSVDEYLRSRPSLGSDP